MSAERAKVICPWCADEGARSTISIRSGAVTGMMWEPYYDEDGDYHSHDPNGSGRWHQCSRGHQWSPASNPCPSCDELARPARLFGRRCPYSRTPHEEGKFSCPECGQEVWSHGGQWIDRARVDEPTVDDHYVRVDESVPESSTSTGR